MAVNYGKLHVVTVIAAPKAIRERLMGLLRVSPRVRRSRDVYLNFNPMINVGIEIRNYSCCSVPCVRFIKDNNPPILSSTWL
jgi:hypothetical protein